MNSATVTLILGILVIVAVAFMGGRASIKGVFEIDTPGLIHWLLKAKEEKGQPVTSPAESVNPLPTQPLIQRLIQQPTKIKLPRATIVWADDKPLNNVFERQAFASMGILCDSYTSNDEALTALDRVKYDLVVSDIGRKGRAETGWDLLAQVKKGHADTPFIFYTMGITEDIRSKAIANGAAGITETPDDLAQLVLNLISKHT